MVRVGRWCSQNVNMAMLYAVLSETVSWGLMKTCHIYIISFVWARHVISNWQVHVCEDVTQLYALEQQNITFY